VGLIVGIVISTIVFFFGAAILEKVFGETSKAMPENSSFAYQMENIT